VLILRDVLCWKAEEVAHLLETTVASVTSALQRARSTLKAVDLTPGEPLRPSDPAQRELLTRYCTAFERHDITALVALLHEDATMSMPPFTWWLRGRDRIQQALLDPDASCEGARLVPTAANGSPAFWQMRPGPGGVYVPFGLVLLDVSEGLIIGITTYLDADRLIPLFGSPAEAPGRRKRFCRADEFPGASAYHPRQRLNRKPEERRRCRLSSPSSLRPTWPACGRSTSACSVRWKCAAFRTMDPCSS
jgi:RNA polymerase sigma-70 factor (ECF subfamily)